MPITGEQVRAVYTRRFEQDQDYRNRIWRVLIKDFFTPYVPPDGVVLDLGCGYGQFINHAACSKRYAMDLNPKSQEYLTAGVIFLEQDCSTRWPLPDDNLDLVFTSNFFEHLLSKDALTATLQEAHRCLRPGGRLIAMGPNIKVVQNAYWDFYDHYLPLTDLSMTEGLEVNGFQVERSIPRFLPYTMVGKRQQPMFMVRAYLRLPFVWRWLGHQFLVVAKKA